ncbi:hypothetical protein ACUOFC_31355, partial [Escherichia sp. TWPC-MK]
SLAFEFSIAKSETFSSPLYFIKRFIPTKELVDKNHLGYLLTYLSSDFSTSITGAAITVDRGHSIW